jgi:SAM-dependent methyltransferase
MQRHTDIDIEIVHGEKISECAETIWGWTTDVGKERLKKRANKILSPLGNLPSSRILEVGCGTGPLSRFFSILQDVTAIDVSFHLLRKAAQETYKAKIDFVGGDAVKLPFKDESFGAVVGNSVMHHFALRKFLPEAFRVLQPGGKISFAEPNMLNPQIMLQKNVPFLMRIVDDVPHETAFLRWSLGLVLKRHNFCDVHITPFDFLHPATPKSWITLIQYMSEYLEHTPLLREIAGSLHIYGEKP